VLADRVVELFDFEAGTVLDGTVGQAGHAVNILNARPRLKLVCVDRDPNAIEAAKRRLAGFSDRVAFLHSSFSNLQAAYELAGERFVGMLLDLGVSLDQLRDAARGFSFSEPGPLDMRFDPSQSLTAHEIVNRWSADELEQIFREYGEERRARSVAAAIVRARSKKPIETTMELAGLVAGVVRRAGRIHPATRVFMAIRIAVNRELDELKSFLEAFPRYLATGGTTAIISFHSLEDRLVKRCFARYARSGFEHGDERMEFELIYKKPLTAGDREVRMNPRARSAKLRAIRRVR